MCIRDSLSSGDQRLDEPESTSLDGPGQAQPLLFALHGSDHGVRAGEPGGHGDGFEDGKTPGGDVDELDLVPATAPTPVQILRLRNPSGPAGSGDTGRPVYGIRPASVLDDPAARLREFLQQLLRERHARLRGRALLSPGGRSFLRAVRRGLWSGGLGLPRA